MLLFVAGDFFRRHRRLRRPTDDVPLSPLLDFVRFWILLALGTFAFAAAVLYAVAFQVGATVAVLAVAGAVCVRLAFIFWWRIRM